jgi:hypothetical protein
MKLIELTQGLYTQVDDADYDELNQYNWCAAWSENAQKYYAKRHCQIRGHHVRMHREILLLGKGNNNATDKRFNKLLVDHIDNDSLNNQRSNLRIATRCQNQYNSKKPKSGLTSIYKGVYLHGKKYVVEINENCNRHYIGSYQTEIEAAIAYNEAAKLYHGEFARLNQIKY